MAKQKPKLDLIGQNGNAFAILGLAKRAAKKAEWSKQEIQCFINEATGGNYDNLLQTCMKYFEVG